MATYALVSVVASRDNTNVKVYALPDGNMEEEATLDAMKKRFFPVSNGTFFKVVSTIWSPFCSLAGET